MKRMCKYMYNRARNHRVNFGNILDKAVSMVKVLDNEKEGNPGYLGDLQVRFFYFSSVHFSSLLLFDRVDFGNIFDKAVSMVKVLDNGQKEGRATRGA